MRAKDFIPTFAIIGNCRLGESAGASRLKAPSGEVKNPGQVAPTTGSLISVLPDPRRRCSKFLNLNWWKGRILLPFSKGTQGGGRGPIFSDPPQRCPLKTHFTVIAAMHRQPIQEIQGRKATVGWIMCIDKNYCLKWNLWWDETTWYV